jgi:hypothetical protein
LVYRLPAADGGRLDPRRGLLNLAVAARRGLQPRQVWEHSQKLHGGLDVLAGVNGAEQGAGLELLWGAVGRLLAAVPQADVIADCGRVGVDGPIYDLLAHAASVVLLSRATVGEVIRLRDRVSVLAAALKKRGRSSVRIDVVVVADYRHITSAVEEVGHALRQSGAPARVVGALAHEPKSAEQLRGEWGGKLDKSMFIRTARAIAADLMAGLPEPAAVSAQSAGASGHKAEAPVQPPRPVVANPQGIAERDHRASQQPPGAGQPQPSYRPAPGGPTQQLPHRSAAPSWQPHQPVPAVSPRPPAPGQPGIRGRHAGTPDDPTMAQAQPQPERDETQSATQLPEATSGTPHGRPRGR